MSKQKYEKIKKKLFEIDQQYSIKSVNQLQKNILNKDSRSFQNKNLSDWTNQQFLSQSSYQFEKSHRQKVLPKLKQQIVRYSSSLNSYGKKMQIGQSCLSPVHLQFGNRTIRMQPVMKFNQSHLNMDKSINNLMQRVTNHKNFQLQNKIHPATQRSSSVIRILKKMQPVRRLKRNQIKNIMKDNGVIIKGLFC